MKTETSPTQKTSPKRARKASTGPQKPVRKANGKGKAKGTKRAFGAHLGDFDNDQTIKVLKPKELTREACFKTGQTVAQCLTTQKAEGFRGRRKYIRKAREAGRIEIH